LLITETHHFFHSGPIKNSTCPVLTIPGKWPKTDFKKVLLPVILNPGNLETYLYSRPIIEKNKSELFLLGLYEQEKDLVDHEISTLIDKMKLQLANSNVVFKSEMSHSKDFPAKILNAAKEYDVDLIILSANLDYDFKAYFIGPLVQQIVNHCRLPVLSIKPKS